MIYVGDPSEWIDLIDTLVPDILELLIDSWGRMPPPTLDAHEDSISESLCRRLQKNPKRDDLPFQIRTQIVELDPGAGADQGRMDIVFLLLVPRENVYFCLECKRLNVMTSGHIRAYSAEYVRFGMQRFVKGQYSPSVRQGAMLAYVLDGDVVRAIQNVATVIQVNQVALGMTAPGSLSASTVRPADARVKETRHVRIGAANPFHLHHVFVS
ncbi:MAG TPA: hypothetical protein VFX20_13795 [Steroidobacteraceae bacterium]|nr:hypothetical protein [Steroidobacteraceae bacterium]